jgi:ParB-like chromosome segregation protein Spo0J
MHGIIHNLNVEYMSPNSLNAYSGNARTNSQDQLKQIAKSIKEFGFTTPILIDNQKTIISKPGDIWELG